MVQAIPAAAWSVAGVVASFFQTASAGAARASAGNALSPIVDLAGQVANEVAPVRIPAEGVLVEAFRRKIITQDSLVSLMRKLGVSEERLKIIVEATAPNVPVLTMIDALRRGLVTQEQFNDEAQKSGFNALQMEYLQSITMFQPGPSDVISFLARNALEPDVIKKFGLDDRFDGLDKSWAKKAGLSEDVFKLFWRAHWNYPSFNQVADMVNRGIFGDDALDSWFDVVDYPPFFRDALKGIAKNTLTRVDIERMWVLGILDDDQTEAAFRANGYGPENAHRMLLFTKANKGIPDIRAMYQNAWISRDDLVARIKDIGLPEDAADRAIKRIIKDDTVIRTVAQRDLTRADITAGVKLGILDPDSGVQMLQDTGYSYDEAVYILAIGKAISADSAPFPFTAATFQRAS